ncbi:MAG TPA: ATPase domain-containing protein [Nitrososphaerales archaeon]|nr:ATPase domain-containing protein [Nitrososphaerales archaeon]
MSTSTAKLRTGVSGLDSILDGGFSDSRVILILGEPGTGKTIVCSQFLYYGATEAKEKAVFIGMNEPKSRFMSEMKELGMDFEKLEASGMFAYVDATEVRRIPDEARVGRIPVGGRELGLVNLMDTIQEAIQKFSPRRVVVDSISDLVFRFPKIEERRPVVLDLVETLQSTKAACLMTSELLSTGEGRTLQPEEYLAEGVILMRTVQKGARSIQVLKMRGSKVDTHPRPYVIKESGLEVYATEEIY